MSSLKAVYFSILFIFFLLSIAHADGNRDLIIQKELDCAAGHLSPGSTISWNDVCDLPDPESSAQQHMDIVNQQMDEMQGNGSSQVNTHEFQAQPKKPVMTYEIDSEISGIDYQEPSLHVKESGVMSGIDGSVTYRPEEGNTLHSEISDMYRLEGRFSYGKVDYSGALVNLSTGATTPETFNGISDYMLEFRGLIGKDFKFNNDSTLLTPYFGGGYRYLFDASYANKPGGYNRKIQYLYLPIGAEVINQLGNGWSIGLDGEYDFLLSGVVNSYLGNIGLGNETNIQKHGYGMRGSIKLIKSWNRYNIVLEPYFRYWHIQSSQPAYSNPFDGDLVLVGVEPDNNSLEIGGKLGVEF